MNRKRTAAWSSILLVVAATAPAVASGAGRGAASSAACAAISAAKVRSVVGLSQSAVLRDYDATTSDSEAQRTECGLGAWSGATPTTPQAVLQAGKTGHGALVGIGTWAPNSGSPNVDKWLNNDYDKLTGGFDIEAVTFPGLFSAAGWPAQHVQTPGYGYQSAGFKVAVQGRGKGLVAAVAAGGTTTAPRRSACSTRRPRSGPP